MQIKASSLPVLMKTHVCIVRVKSQNVIHPIRKQLFRLNAISAQAKMSVELYPEKLFSNFKKSDNHLIVLIFLAVNMTNEMKFKSTVNVIEDEMCEDFYNKPLIYLKRYDHFTKLCINVTDPICRGAGVVMAEDWTDQNHQPYIYAVGFYAVLRPTCLGVQQIERTVPHMHWLSYVIKP